MPLLPDQKASMISSPSDEGGERAQAETTRIASPSLSPCPPLVHEAMASYALTHPTDVAAVFGRGDGQEETLTYGILNRCSNQLAHALTREGVGPEIVVGIARDRADSLLMLVSFWAVLKCGGAVLLLNPGASYPRARRDAVIREAGVTLLLTQRHLRSQLPSDVQEMILSSEKLPTLFSEEPEEMPDVEIKPETLAYLVATSSTSAGTPNLVQVKHQSLANLAAAQIAGFGIRRGDRVLQFSSWTFDAVISEIVMASRGATLVMGSRHDLRPGPEMVHFLSSHQVTVATLTPSVLLDPKLPRSDLAPLRLLICAGEVLHRAVISRYSRPGLQIFNAYGPAECAVCLTLGECQPGDEPPDVGWALPGVELAILDEHREPVPGGARGTLYASGVCLSRGYTDAHLTAERFAVIEGKRWFNTGDLACLLPNGRIRIFGRIDGDRQLKIQGGRRVQLEEIEEALLRHPSLQAAVVISEAEHRQPGHLLLAYLVPKTGSGAVLCCQESSQEAIPSPTLLAEEPSRELRRFLVEQGLENYMLPTSFLVMPSLPRTVHEKVDLTALRALLASERHLLPKRGP